MARCDLDLANQPLPIALQYSLVKFNTIFCSVKSQIATISVDICNTIKVCYAHYMRSCPPAKTILTAYHRLVLLAQRKNSKERRKEVRRLHLSLPVIKCEHSNDYRRAILENSGLVSNSGMEKKR